MMLLRDDREKVVENIREAADSRRLNIKVEPNDPKLTDEQREQIINKFYVREKTFGAKVCNLAARMTAYLISRFENRKTKFVGLENVKGLRGGCIITSNHFNPIEIMAVNRVANKMGHRRLYKVSQETNCLMGGFMGFMLNYCDIVPICCGMRRMQDFFLEKARQITREDCLLIYPEQEMWYNYRKPRTPMRGAYLFAAKLQVPIVSCFVEIRDEKKMERKSDQFRKTRYIVHVLPTIYPDLSLPERERSIKMMNTDYAQKKEAYEKAYGKVLTYDFDYSDIAGWVRA